MATETAVEIRISFTQVIAGGSQEALIEFYGVGSSDKGRPNPPLSVAYVSSSKNDGTYDTVGANADADGDGDVDSDDKEVLCTLATVALKALKEVPLT